MLLIQIGAPKLTKEQKRDLVITLTNNASDIMKVPKEYIMVLIDEVERDNIGFAGNWLGDNEIK